MPSFDKRREYGVQKEWYYLKNGKGIAFAEMKDIPFEIDESFKIRSERNVSSVGQIIRVHPVDENMAWNLITREYNRRVLRLPFSKVAEDKNTKMKKLMLENIERIKDELA
ncbi:MAG: hypothetical protein QXO03_04200 [Thermoplasmatales archaeon]